MEETKVLHKKKVIAPKLRFKGFNDEWKIESLTKLYTNIVVGFVGTISNDYCDQTIGIQFIRTLNVKDGWFCNEGLQYVTKEFHKKNKKSQVTNGDILIARVGANMGLVCEITGLVEEANSANVIIIKNQPNLSSSFYALYLSSPKGQKQIQSKGAGGAQEVLNISVAKTIKVPLLSISEQQKIASFLSAVDEKMQLLKLKKQLLEQYKKGVMQQLFSGKLRFKDENGKAYPKWQMVGGDKLFDSISDKKHNSDLPILAITQEQGAVPREMINYQMTVTDSSIASYKVVQVGDFIISLRSFQGGIEYSNYKGICSPAYNILRPSSDDVNREFYRYYLKTAYYIKQLQKNLEGIRDGKMISYKYFSEIKLPFPSKEEQKKIADFLSIIDVKIESLSKQINQTQNFKKGLLQQMFV